MWQVMQITRVAGWIGRLVRSGPPIMDESADGPDWPSGLLIRLLRNLWPHCLKRLL